MPATYLRITITPHRPGSLPGYDGDRRVEWSIAEDAVSIAEAQRKTRDALRVLRAFWEEGAPGGLRFSEFAKTVLADGPSSPTTPVPTTRGKLGSSEDGDDDMGEDQIDLVDPLAEKLVRHPNVLPAFLSDLRDWDSFRLLLRRHGGEVPFEGNGSPVQAVTSRANAAGGDSNTALVQSNTTTDNSSTSEHSSSSSPPLTQPPPGATSVLLSALATRERQWQDERASLHAALWAAGEQVRTLVATLTDALEKVAAISDGATDCHSVPSRTSKTVRWDDVVLKREVIRESAAQWGLGPSDGNHLDWKEAEWLKELAKQEQMVRSRGDSGPGLNFSLEDILAVVKAGRRLTNHGATDEKDGYMYVTEQDDDHDEDDDTEEDIEDDMVDARQAPLPQGNSGPAASVIDLNGHAQQEQQHDDDDEDDTESEDETNAAMLTARLEQLRKLADLAVANAAGSADSEPVQGAAPSAEQVQDAVHVPTAAPLPPIEEAEGEPNDPSASSEAPKADTPILIASGRRPRSRPSLDSPPILIASGRRDRPASTDSTTTTPPKMEPTPPSTPPPSVVDTPAQLVTKQRDEPITFSEALALDKLAPVEKKRTSSLVKRVWRKMSGEFKVK
ncbi:hypothetical protein SpCBS45565_g05908 [Spizellomyces sp. 'palustris']|nr:hypothetical protein SpCBS45565_g05908 [Spizellomyces sp. 'palustris']